MATQGTSTQPTDASAPQEADYKATLNLPETAFAMKANLPTRENDWLTRWENDAVYQRIRQSRQGKPQYILHDGPPYANGQIHLGHAVNKVLKDIIVKSKTLSGFDAPYVPGWDCHGLPIELKVEEKVGKVGVNVDANAFRKACRDYAASQVELQKADFKRLGVLADWNNPYLTMQFKQEADTVRALGKIVAAGHVQAGMKPVNWCMDCGSALAEAEVEYEEKRSDAIDVGFRVTDVAALNARLHTTLNTPVDVVIWTTTPWTLPANQAVALNAEIEYCVLHITLPQGEARHLVVAQGLSDAIATRYKTTAHAVVTSFKGKVLEGLLVQHPLIAARQVPIILGDHVTADSGTGAVHTAPGHGVDDYKVGLVYHLPVDNPVGGNGVYLPTSPVFAGQHIYKANPQIITQLEEAGLLYAHATIMHSYPHCWRHKTPIIFRATPQWFINMEQQGLRASALNAIKTVRWTPDWGQNRIEAMVKDRPDWCISRQRTWGVPIAFYIRKDTGALHPNTPALIEIVAQYIEQGGIEAWFNLDHALVLGADSADYVPVKDTLDVWFDSGVTHFAVLRQRDELSFPADLYLEGSDQHRGWFQTSLLAALAISDEKPFKHVLTHGFVVDEHGHKMSKSKGNIITPQEVINSMGADVLRFWIATSDYRYEMAAGKEIFNRAIDGYRRIRNTLRFLLANLHGFVPNQHMQPVEQLVALDAYIVKRAAQVQAEVIAAYDAMDFHVVTKLLVDFCSKDLGGFYLDIIKDRQYTIQTQAVARLSAQTALYHISQALIRWMSPILSFTAQEAWELLPEQHEPYVFTSYWHVLPEVVNQEILTDTDWQTILQAKMHVNKALEEARNQKIIGASLAAHITLWANAPYGDSLAKLGDELRFVLICSKVTVLPFDADAGNATEDTALRVHIQMAEGQKCTRCWHVRPDVGTHAHHPLLCSRCIDNVDGQGEVRRYA